MTEELLAIAYIDGRLATPYPSGEGPSKVDKRREHLSGQTGTCQLEPNKKDDACGRGGNDAPGL